ncbi:MULTISPECIES: DUF6292 family protein [Saccharopolyspora]|uniref:DUF6292 family protein n=1 Tax=Saccharopolyspora cebuensis TaxID=418759 RepID=A0ABV4CMC6_9PSEU
MDAQRATGGLRTYIHVVSSALGGAVDVVDIDASKGPATAIILLHSTIPTLPELPLLLTWDEINGWALRVKISDDGDTTALGYLGDEILPDPAVVRTFLTEAVDGGNPGVIMPPGFRTPGADDDLEHRLAHFDQPPF